MLGKQKGTVSRVFVAWAIGTVSSFLFYYLLGLTLYLPFGFLNGYRSSDVTLTVIMGASALTSPLVDFVLLKKWHVGRPLLVAVVGNIPYLVSAGIIIYMLAAWTDLPAI